MRPAAAQDVIAALRLLPHPEGGFYRETWRSPHRVATPRGERSALTVIHYLLPAGAVSAFHRVQADEVWHHVEGDALELHVVGADGAYATHLLHASRADGACDHAVVPAGAWQGARPRPGGAGYALVSCAVAPGFEFEDFELATRDGILTLRPDLAALAGALCPAPAR